MYPCGGILTSTIEDQRYFFRCEICNSEIEIKYIYKKESKINFNLVIETEPVMIFEHKSIPKPPPPPPKRIIKEDIVLLWSK